ncbi:MAG: hypothetical protein AAFW84_04845 [Cyanobacteria bacterium J06635_15]
MPDGQTRILAEYDNMPVDKAHLYLDAEGLCKTGPDAIEVRLSIPLKYPSRRSPRRRQYPLNLEQSRGLRLG